MSKLSFAHVPPEGFVAFSAQLKTDPWASIDTKDWEGPGQTAAKSLGDAPTWISLKLRIAWTIGTLIQAMEGSGIAKDCDIAWDNGQKQLKSLLAAAAAGSDTAKREAASRLQKSLLTGAGEGQTKLKYQQEVDFGHKQALITSQGQGAADVALLGLGNMMAEIAQATSALAAAIGHGQSSARPFERQKAATLACASVFGDAVELLIWLGERGMPDADRERAEGLRLSLSELSARYPAAGGSASGNQNAAGTAAGGSGEPS